MNLYPMLLQLIHMYIWDVLYMHINLYMLSCNKSGQMYISYVNPARWYSHNLEPTNWSNERSYLKVTDDYLCGGLDSTNIWSSPNQNDVRLGCLKEIWTSHEYLQRQRSWVLPAGSCCFFRTEMNRLCHVFNILFNFLGRSHQAVWEGVPHSKFRCHSVDWLDHILFIGSIVWHLARMRMFHPT